MVGVDAPEVIDPSPLLSPPRALNATPTPPQRSHFGKPAQAHSDEALAWLKEHIHGRRLKCQLFQRDQYGRIVALPLLPHHRWWPWSRRSATRNLPLEMVRAGWGVVYTGAGAKYGDWGQAVFLAAQAEAQYVVFMSLSRAAPRRYLIAVRFFNQGRRGGVCGTLERTSRRLQSTRSGIARRQRVRKSQKRN